MQAGAFGYYGEEEEGEEEAMAPASAMEEMEEEEHRENPWQNRPLWNICKCCDHGVRAQQRLLSPSRFNTFVLEGAFQQEAGAVDSVITLAIISDSPTYHFG